MKISDKLAKVDSSFTVNMYDNGFMFDISGRDDNDDWSDAKVLCPTVDDVVKLINEVVKLPRD